MEVGMTSCMFYQARVYGSTDEVVSMTMAVPGSLPKHPPSKLGYADLKRCHTEAYNFLSKALQLDESGRGACLNPP